ncbi:MAG: Hpt domain-containing protein [Rhodocyclales bacterium GT-UBC]|nr:MAG: Hpt domain-containing protein [Rhodocyclales bacterium GT-UBC]
MAHLVDGADSASCNLNYLLGNLGGNLGAAKRLVSLYLENHPVLLHALDVALQRNDPKAVRQAVHDIRGSCVIFSAHTCLELAKKIEDGLRQLPEQGVTAEHGIGACFEECAALTVAMDEMAEELRSLLSRESI